MKKILLLFLFASQLFLAQMPDISTVFLNNSKPYSGTIGLNKTVLRLKINIAEQDKKNSQNYFISGYTLMNDKYVKFEGTILITKYKDGDRHNSVFGTYEMAQDPAGENAGLLTGKFIYTFRWDKKSKTIENPYLEFIGEKKNYKTKTVENTVFNN